MRESITRLVKGLRRESQSLIEEASIAEMMGNREKGDLLLDIAYRLDRLNADFHAETMAGGARRAGILRTASWLAMRTGRARDALMLALRGLGGEDVPATTADQLHEIRNEAEAALGAAP